MRLPLLRCPSISQSIFQVADMGQIFTPASLGFTMLYSGKTNIKIQHVPFGKASRVFLSRFLYTVPAPGKTREKRNFFTHVLQTVKLFLSRNPQVWGFLRRHNFSYQSRLFFFKCLEDLRWSGPLHLISSLLCTFSRRINKGGTRSNHSPHRREKNLRNNF